MWFLNSNPDIPRLTQMFKEMSKMTKKKYHLDFFYAIIL